MQTTPGTRRRLVVAMSGGVDSSVAAALVVARGDEAIGITLHLAGSDSRCCSLADADDARRVAERLGVRFFVANYRERFRKEVVEAFADAYLAGRTPIPCLACNRSFKFEYLLERARVFGAEGVVSGHYARVLRDAETGLYKLRAARDSAKDQSYFLFQLGQQQLAALEFPLGELTKGQVREIARDCGLATADKPESQEICFVPDGDYAEVVERIRPDRLPGPGEIVNATGQVLGVHGGIHRFTVGQRKGLGLSNPGGPLYVTALDAARNRVRVGTRAELEALRARVLEVHWVSGRAPEAGTRARVRVRHRHAGTNAELEPLGQGETLLHFEEPVSAVAPGQAAVFYQGDEVLGGGFLAGASP